ncbi:MAG: hypothetical protein IKD07_07240, partial [Clostridia bacterium]|nr:hypothetical protein [Clostridia bacterium]
DRSADLRICGYGGCFLRALPDFHTMRNLRINHRRRAERKFYRSADLRICGYDSCFLRALPDFHTMRNLRINHRRRAEQKI